MTPLNSTTHPHRINHPSALLHVSLWLSQLLLALTFFGGGIWKLATPLPDLAVMIPWAREEPLLLRLTAVLDLLGGLGVLLPAATRIQPRLSVLAACGCGALQLAAIVFHVARREAAHTPFNFLLLAVSAFVVWGRESRAPISPRR